MIKLGDRYLLIGRRRCSDRVDVHDAVDTRLHRPVMVLIAHDGVTVDAVPVDAPGTLLLLDRGTGTPDTGARSWIVTEAEFAPPARTVEPGSLSPESVLQVADDVAHTMYMLHRARRTHGSLGPDAVLIEPRSRARVVDIHFLSDAQPEADISAFGRLLQHLLGPEPEPEWGRVLHPDGRLDLGHELHRLARDLTSERRGDRPPTFAVVLDRIDVIRRARMTEIAHPGHGVSAIAEAERRRVPNDLLVLLAAAARGVPPRVSTRIPGWTAAFERYGMQTASARPRTARRAGRGSHLRRYNRRRLLAAVAGVLLSAIAIVGVAMVTAAAGVQTHRDVVAIPSVVGASPAAAVRTLAAAGFGDGGRAAEYSLTIPVGRVIGTSPAAGSPRQPGTPVVLLVSNGPANVDPSQLVGMTLAGAQHRLGAAGLVLGDLVLQPADAPFGKVVAATRSGEEVRGAQAIDLVITSGKQLVPADLAGHDPAAATGALTAAGFAVTLRTVDTADSPDGLVIGAEPAPGVPATPGSTVVLLVAHLVDPGPSVAADPPVPAPTSGPSAPSSPTPSTPTPGTRPRS